MCVCENNEHRKKDSKWNSWFGTERCWWKGWWGKNSHSSTHEGWWRRREPKVTYLFDVFYVFSNVVVSLTQYYIYDWCFDAIKVDVVMLWEYVLKHCLTHSLRSSFHTRNLAIPKLRTANSDRNVNISSTGRYLSQQVYVQIGCAPDPRDFVNLIVAMTRVEEWNASVCDLLRRMLMSSLTSESYYLRLRTSLDVLQRVTASKWMPRSIRDRQCILGLLGRVSKLRDSPYAAKASETILSEIRKSWTTS